MEFAWRGINVGDHVRVVASAEELKEICAEDFKDYVGQVRRISGDAVTIKFVNTVRLFNTYMLEKSTDWYEDWLDSPEADLLIKAYETKDME